MKWQVFGITLIELLCVMTCLMILLLLTAGGWHRYSGQLQHYAALERIKSAVAFAQLQAIMRHTSIIYCGSSDLRHCDGNWSQGQLVQTTEPVSNLRTYSGMKAIQISFHANFGHNRQVEFQSTGFTNGQNGHFDVCLATEALSRACESLILHFSGQMVKSKKKWGMEW